MSEPDKLREIRPRWADFPGDSFPPEHDLWGCAACLVRREAVREDLRGGPPGRDGWGEPEGTWARFRADGERRAELAAGWAGLRREERLSVREVWDAHPEGQPRSLDARANRYRVRLSDDRWVSGNLLRCLHEMTGWEETWSAAGKGPGILLLVRPPTLVADRVTVAAVGRVATIVGQPFDEWGRLWPLDRPGPTLKV